MTEAQILALAGTTASLLTFSSGFLHKKHPGASSKLVSAAGAVMLLGNLLVLLL